MKRTEIKTILGYKSEYSFAESANRTKVFATKAKEMGYETIAITDSNNMHFAVDFKSILNGKNKKGEVLGLNHIFGLELSVKDVVLDDYHSVRVIANSNKGYSSLMKLTTAAKSDGDSFDYVTLEQIAEHQEGLFVFNGGINSELFDIIAFDKTNSGLTQDELLEALFDKWSIIDNYLIEVDAHLPKELNQKVLDSNYLKNFISDNNKMVVAVPKVYYRRESDSVYRALLEEIETGKKTLKPTARYVNYNDTFYMMNSDELYELYDDVLKVWPDVFENAEKIGDLSKGVEYPTIRKLPHFPCPEEISIMEGLPAEKTNGDSSVTLRLLSLKGFDRLYPLMDPSDSFDGDRSNLAEGFTTKDYINQIEFELDVIKTMGFDDYFLIFQDMIHENEKEGVMFGPGRGSAAGSLVALSLGITKRIDPLKQGLFFERFLNPNRISMPDIDVDISQKDRDKVYHYLQKTYGYDKTAQIATFQTLALKQSIKVVGKHLGLSFEMRNEMTKAIPDRDSENNMITTYEQLVDVPYFARLLNDSEVIQELFEIGPYVVDMPRNTGKHAAGAVVSAVPLDEISPTMEVDGGMVTQLEKNNVEHIGLLKLDLLGLMNLDIIQNTINQLISDGYQIPIEGGLENIYQLPTNIEECNGNEELEEMVNKTYAMLAEGDSSNVFQLESFGMRNLLKNIDADDIKIIDAVLALYRPGPMAMIPDYIEGRKLNDIKNKKNKWFNDVTAETYGILIYQEQVISLAQTMSGMSAADADIFRKAIGSKDMELLEVLKPKFIQGAVDTNNVDELEATDIFELILNFASYGFNRAHSASYALLSYITAFLKANYRATYLAEVMNVQSSDSDKLKLTLTEVQKVAPITGVNLIRPSVGDTTARFSVRRNPDGTEDIVYGFNGLSAVSEELAESLGNLAKMDKRKLQSLDGVLKHIPRHLRKSNAIKNLILAGAFDKFSPKSREALLVAYQEQLVEWLKFNESAHEFMHYLDEPQIKIKESVEMNTFEKLRQEKRVAHIYLTEHPLSSMQGKTVKELLEFHIGQPSAMSDSSINELPTTLGELEETMMEIIKANDEEGAGLEERVSAWVLAFGDVRTINTKAGETMGLLNLEDISSGELTVALFPSTYETMSTQQGTESAMLDKLTAVPLLIKVSANRNRNNDTVALALDLPPFSDKITDINKIFYKLDVDKLSRRYFVSSKLINEDIVSELSQNDGLDELIIVDSSTLEIKVFPRKVNLSNSMKEKLNLK